MEEKYREMVSNLQNNFKGEPSNYSKSSLDNADDDSLQDRETLISNILNSSGDSQISDGMCAALDIFIVLYNIWRMDSHEHYFYSST